MCRLSLVLIALCLFGASVSETIVDGQCDDDLPLQEDFDLEEFSGLWYEISRTPNQYQSGDCVSYQFTYDNGSIQVETTTVDANFGQSATGTLEPVYKNSSRLILNLSSIPQAIDYSVVDVVYSIYALVVSCRNVSPTQKGIILWKLGRDPVYPNVNIDVYLDTVILNNFGINASDTMIDVVQSEDACYELPVIEQGNPIILPGQCNPSIPVVGNFDLDRFSGLWHYIASYETEGVVGNCHRTTYTVVNQNGFTLENSRVINGALDIEHDSVTLASTDASARLNINLRVDNEIIQIELWVLGTDYENYALTYACRNVNENQMRVWSWKMTRSRRPSQVAESGLNDIVNSLIILNDQYYQLTDQTDESCFYYPEHVENRPVVFRGACDQNIQVVQNFDAARYMGLWHEIESYPSQFQTGTCNNARYTLTEADVEVYNTQVIGQRLDYIYGSAVLASPDDGQAKLVVSFPIAGTNETTQTDYWVLATDYDSYALVYTCSQIDEESRGVWSWKLSRSKQLSEAEDAIMNAIIDTIPVLDERYYQVRDQTPEGCFFYPEPVEGQPVLFPGQCDESILAAADFQVDRFGGVWYEIEAYPKLQTGVCVNFDCTNTAANTFDMTITSVINDFREIISGSAQRSVNDNSGKFQLNLNIDGQATPMPYWILATNYDDYALAYSCVNVDQDWRRVFSWKLSRSREGLSIAANQVMNSIISSIQVLGNEYYETTDQSEDACFFLPDIPAGQPVIIEGQCDNNVAVVENFDPFRYQGLWKNIESYDAEFEDGTCNEATYTIGEDGEVIVYNTQVINQTLDHITGRADLEFDDGSAKLIVTFEVGGVNVTSSYWVLSTDYDYYSLVYSCTNLDNNRMRVYSWKLSRTRELTQASVEAINEAMSRVRVLNQRFYTRRLHSDDDCFYYPEHIINQPVTFRGVCDEGIQVVQNFDAGRYMGLWHEIESYPSQFQTGTCNNARYTLTEADVEVYNTQVIGQRLDYIYGSAVLASPDDGQAKLVVSFPIAGTNETTETNYWVLTTDYDNYALVYTCAQLRDDRRGVWSWKLSRRKELSPAENAIMDNVIASIPVLDERYYQTRDQTPEGCFFFPEPVQGQQVIFPGQCDENIEAVTNFDLNRFGGVWSEVAAYPYNRNGECPSFEYSATSTDTFDVRLTTVVDYFLDAATSGAVRTSNDNSAKFEVLIDNPDGTVTRVPYWILATDYDNYALIYSCRNVDQDWRQVNSWKLSRTRSGLSSEANQAINEVMSSIEVLADDYYEDTDQSDDACFFLPDIPAGEPVVIEGPCDPNIPVMQNFDPFRYQGLWRSIESYYSEFEEGFCNEATYALGTDNVVSVFNTQVVNQTLDTMTGTAVVDGDDGSGRLIVSFPIGDTGETTQSNYWVLSTDYESYSLVYSCANLPDGNRRVHSWKLSRERELSAASNQAINEVVSRVRELHERFYIRRIHSDEACFFYPEPVPGQSVVFRGQCDENIQVLQNFDVARYLGTWYDVESYPQEFQQGTCPTAYYSLGEEGVDVYNTQVVGQQLDTIRGVAVPASDDGLGKLIVRFPIQGTELTTESDYWILDTDYDNYSLVYSCRNLDGDERIVTTWKLSRTPTLDSNSQSIIDGIMDTIPVLRQQYYEERGHTEEDCFFYPDNNGKPVVLEGDCEADNELQIVTDFDPDAFAGTWREIARFPFEHQTGQCANGVYEYNATSNTFIMSHTIVDQERMTTVYGVAEIANDNRGILTSTFPNEAGEPVQSTYYILATDYTEYALIYSCVDLDANYKKVYSWKLGRGTTLSDQANEVIDSIVSNQASLFEGYYDQTDQSDDACFHYPEFDDPPLIELPGSCDQTIRAKPDFNFEAYLGQWYEFARFPQPFQVGECARADYSPDGNIINVVNTVVDQQELETVRGTATIVPTDDNSGLLEVTFVVNGVPNVANYYVLETDYTNFALVYSCRNTDTNTRIVSSWKLSRQRNYDSQYDTIMDPIIEETQGLLEEYYIYSDQSDEACFYIPKLEPNQPVLFRGQCDESISGVPNFNMQQYLGWWHEIQHYSYGSAVGTCLSTRYEVTEGQFSAIYTSVSGVAAEVTTIPVQVSAAFPGRLRKILPDGRVVDVWVLATDYETYSLLYYCENVEDDQRLVWSAKQSNTRQLSAEAIIAINNTIQQHDVLVNDLYITVDQSDPACFHYPEQTTDEIILPGQCDVDIPVVTQFDPVSFTGDWYLVEKYPDGTRGGSCVGTRFTEDSDALQLLHWEVQDDELVTNEGTVTMSPDGSGRLNFTVTVPGTDETTTSEVYVLNVDYASHAFLYSCRDINQFQRVVRSWKLSRERDLSTDSQTAINNVITARQELHPPYYAAIDQEEGCLEPDAAFSIKSSLIIIFTCLILIFTS